MNEDNKLKKTWSNLAYGGVATGASAIVQGRQSYDYIYHGEDKPIEKVLDLSDSLESIDWSTSIITGVVVAGACFLIDSMTKDNNRKYQNLVESQRENSTHVLYR